MTDQSKTYPLFTYLCGEMQWTATKSGKGAIIGYNAHRKVFFNHPSSGYGAIALVVNCGVQGRRKRALGGAGCKSENPDEIDTCGDGDNRNENFCTCNERKKDVNMLLQKKLAEVRDKMSPCPLKAETFDLRFIKQPNTTNPLCFVSTFYTSYAPNKAVDGITYKISKQCCYSSE